MLITLSPFKRWLQVGQLKLLIEAYCGRKQGKKKDDTFDEMTIPVIDKIVSRHFQTVISFIYNSLFMITNL